MNSKSAHGAFQESKLTLILLYRHQESLLKLKSTIHVKKAF